jgi:hypothetical protein
LGVLARRQSRASQHCVQPPSRFCIIRFNVLARSVGRSLGAPTTCLSLAAASTETRTVARQLHRPTRDMGNKVTGRGAPRLGKGYCSSTTSYFAPLVHGQVSPSRQLVAGNAKMAIRPQIRDLEENLPRAVSMKQLSFAPLLAWVYHVADVFSVSCGERRCDWPCAASDYWSPNKKGGMVLAQTHENYRATVDRGHVN